MYAVVFSTGGVATGFRSVRQAKEYAASVLRGSPGATAEVRRQEKGKPVPQGELVAVVKGEQR
jgi:hypothetical protein